MSMKYKVIIDPQAKLDLNEIFCYVAMNYNIQFANKILADFEETCFKPGKIPEQGLIPPELKSTGIKRYLEIHYKPYRIIYEIGKNLIYIHCVIDAEEISWKS